LHFLIFVLVISCSCVYIRPGQDSRDRTPRTGQPKKDSQNRTATMRQVEQDCLDRRDRTGQPGHESQDVTGRNMTG
jgi:hypothetical protein